MTVVPILTSGRLLVQQGLAPPPSQSLEGDWAELQTVDVEPPEASTAGSYWSSGYTNFLATGDPNHLTPFKDRTVGGFPLVTDPDLLEDFYYGHGHVDFQEWYQP